LSPGAAHLHTGNVFQEGDIALTAIMGSPDILRSTQIRRSFCVPF
jgi:hypothetical protein